MKRFVFVLALFFVIAGVAPMKKYQKKELSFTDAEFRVDVVTFETRKPILGTVLILPPTGGATILDQSFAEKLADRGFNAVILEKWTGDAEDSLDLEIHKRFYERSQRAIALVVENTDSAFIGVLGTSVGAIHAAVATHHIARIKAAFLVVGGAPIAEVIASSDQKVLREAKEKRFATMGFTSLEHYTKALDETLAMDPFKSPDGIAGKRLAMVVAQNDTTVPGRNQMALRDLWKPELVLETSRKHTLAIVKTWFFYRDDIADFFVRASR